MILLKKPFADEFGRLDKGPGFLEGDLAIGCPIVKMRHQFLLVGEGQQGVIINPPRQIPIEFSIVRRVGPRESDQVGQASALSVFNFSRVAFPGLTNIEQQ